MTSDGSTGRVASTTVAAVAVGLGVGIGVYVSRSLRVSESYRARVPGDPASTIGAAAVAPELARPKPLSSAPCAGVKPRAIVAVEQLGPPIAKVHSCFSRRNGTPRQGGDLVPSARCVLTLAPGLPRDLLTGMDEYTHVYDAIVDAGGAADQYAALIEAHIRPHIEGTYGSNGVDGLLGSSLGGLVSLVIADRQPAAWDFVASMSGTLGWGKLASDQELIVERWEQPPRGVFLYVDSGGSPGANGCEDPNGDGFVADDPDATDNYCTSREFVDRMAAAGYDWESQLVHWWEPEAPHNEVAWAARVQRPLALFSALND